MSTTALPLDSARDDRLVRQFLPLLVGGLAAWAVVDQTATLVRGDVPRLLAVVVFFGGLLSALWALTAPRRAYMRSRFLDAHGRNEEHLLRHAFEFEDALGAALTPAVWLAVATTASLGVLTLSRYFTPLDALAHVASIVWRAAGLGLLVWLVAGGGRVAAAVHAYGRYRLERDYVRLTRGGVTDAGAGVGGRPVDAFVAGGLDWRWDDFVKNAMVLGQPGSGKTSCVLHAWLDGVLTMPRPNDIAPAALILDPKGDFRSALTDLAGRSGRGDDLVIIDPASPGSSARWNPFDADDDDFELSERLGAVLQSVGVGGPGHDPFWVNAARRFLANALSLCRATNAAGDPPSFGQLHALATSPSAIDARLSQLEGRPPAISTEFFQREWAELPHETRAAVAAHVTNLVEPFCHPPYDTVFGGRSTVSLGDAIDGGRLVYLALPVAERQLMGRVIGSLLKLAYYREVLRRVGKARPSFFFCDEFPAFATLGSERGDVEFFSRSRASNHANLVAAQNLAGFRMLAPGNPDAVDSLLGNCTVQVFLRNTCRVTNEHASRLCGEQVIGFPGAPPAAGWRGLWRDGGAGGRTDSAPRYATASFSELAIPERAAGARVAESVVVVASRARLLCRLVRWELPSATAPGTEAGR